MIYKISFLTLIILSYYQISFTQLIPLDFVSTNKNIELYTMDDDQEIFVLETELKKRFVTQQFEGALLQTALLEKPSGNTGLSTLRFTYFFNHGLNYHLTFNTVSGVYVGYALKNIGFIEKFQKIDSTVKKRVYLLEVPVAFKYGDLVKDRYVFTGAGLGLALNYKEKGYVKRSEKKKFNEWFSDRTSLLMPSVFIGYKSALGLFVKATYYPLNFHNVNFIDTKNGNIKPYQEYNVQIISLSFGINLHIWPRYGSDE